MIKNGLTSEMHTSAKRPLIKQSPNVLKALKELDKQQKYILKLYKDMSNADGGKTYPVDLLATGAIKRALSTTAGFKLLIKAKNILCSRALLRIQIDTAIRFYSIFIVEDCHRYSKQVLSGIQIDHLKDKLGNKMKDAYLVGKLKSEYPWLETVYKNLSGYIHLSADHYFSTIREIRDDTNTVFFEISERDTKFPEFSWLEMIECFKEATKIFVEYLEGWILTKANPEIVSKMKEKLQKAGIQDLTKVRIRITKAKR
jgi:hypothetical protein